jgi:hypothetical protein
MPKASRFIVCSKGKPKPDALPRKLAGGANHRISMEETSRPGRGGCSKLEHL